MDRQIVDQLTEYLLSAEGTDEELAAAFESRFPLATDEDLGSDAKLSNRFDDEFVSYFSMFNADDCLVLMV